MSVQTVVPPELKQISEYVRRANELTRVDLMNPDCQLVAHCCRQYAVETGKSLATTVAGTSALSTITDAIEVESEVMSKFTKEVRYKVCRLFAMEVFDEADEENRTGGTRKETAKTFYAASNFFDVLNQFTEEEGGRGKQAALEEEKKSAYAKRKATDILKAIRQGTELTSRGYDASAEIQNANDIELDEEIEIEVEAAFPEIKMDVRLPSILRKPSFLRKRSTKQPLSTQRMPSMREEEVVVDEKDLEIEPSQLPPPAYILGVRERSRKRDHIVYPYIFPVDSMKSSPKKQYQMSPLPMILSMRESSVLTISPLLKTPIPSVSDEEEVDEEKIEVPAPPAYPLKGRQRRIQSMDLKSKSALCDDRPPRKNSLKRSSSFTKRFKRRSSLSPMGEKKRDMKELMKVVKQSAKLAIKAIDSGDANLARERLREAIEVLGD